MPFIRLFFYLLTLRDQEFYGEVLIPMHKGQCGQIRVSQGFKEELLPLPPVALRGAYQREIAEGLKSVL